MVTVEQALLHLGYDYKDDMVTAEVTRELRTAQATLRGAVGEDVETYLPDDPRADELVLIYLDDLHDNRGVSAKVSNATRLLVHSMEWQLRLELRRAREAGGTA